MNITSMFYSYCEDVLIFLQQTQFNIPQECIQHMRQTIAYTKLYTANSDKVCIELEDQEGTVHSIIHVKSLSQVIDCPPLVTQQDFQKIIPVVVLRLKPNGISKWTFIHEICHLLSIGPYVKQSNVDWTHHFGILSQRYQKTNHGLTRISMDGHIGINELLNDYIVWKILEHFDGYIEAPYHGLEQFRAYIERYCSNTDVHHLIGAYFSGDVEQIKKYLLNSSYVSFSTLYKELTPV